METKTMAKAPKIEWKSEYLHADSKPIGDPNREMHKKLFFPKSEELVGYISEAIKSKDHAFQFFGTYDGEIWNALNHIVQTQYNLSQGEINLQYLFKAIKEVAVTWDMVRFLDSEYKWMESNGVKIVNCTSPSETLVAVGILDEDYLDNDPDPYATAGGYRCWKALAGTKVEYHLQADLSIRLKFDSNCEIDHYNNNFCGNSTGGGTTKYAVGERVEKRGITLGREAFDKPSKNSKIKASVKKIDPDKIRGLIEKYQPELFEATNSKSKRLDCQIAKD
jgi:hypothetical protein